MSLALGIDVLLVVLLALASLGGLRRGLLASIVGLVGFAAGAGLGLWLLPTRVGTIVPDEPALLRPLALITSVLALAFVTAALLSLTVRTAAGRRPSPMRSLDAALGALLSLVMAAVCAWFVAGVVRVAAPADLSAAIARSRVLVGISRVLPTTSESVLMEVATALDSYGFPRVFETLGAEPIREVPAVDPAVADNAAVRTSSRSVLKITAEAPGCSRAQEGSGWVVAPGLVVTNAHVIAGAQTVRVLSDAGRLTARPVAFDPRRDLAVLAVAGLTETPLRLGGPAPAATSAVVAGYPLDGPLRVDAARVREQLRARGSDIHGKASVTRSVYSVRATIQPGNSGGPLLGTDGTVIGVIFARSLDDKATGYALTLEELTPVLAQAGTSGATVDTGACIAG